MIIQVLRGAIGFGYCFGPEKYYRFRAGVWGNPFKVLYGFAKKHIVGPDWDAHRKYLYTASRDAPPVCEDYQLYVFLFYSNILATSTKFSNLRPAELPF